MDKLKAFFIKTREIFNKVMAVIGTWPGRIAVLWRILVTNWKIFAGTKSYSVISKVLFCLFLVFALAETVFAVMIYGFHLENNATKIAAKVVPYPIAVVNYDFVTLGQYENEKTYIHHFYAATNQGNISFSDIDTQILDQLIENRIISMEALRYHAKVTKSDIDQSIATIVDQNGGQDQVTKVLNDLYGLTLNQFRRLVETQLLRDKLNSTVIETVTVRHILINVSATASQADVDAAHAKIVDIQNQIKGGLDFATAATKYSEDTGSASQGGLLDPFAKGEMVQEFSDAAFATTVGQVSDPVRSQYGWHLIKVESKSGSVAMTFTDWLASLKAKSLILKMSKI